LGDGTPWRRRHGACLVARRRAAPTRPARPARERPAATPPRGGGRAFDRRARGLARPAPAHRSRSGRRPRSGRAIRLAAADHDSRNLVRRLPMTRTLPQCLLFGAVLALASVLLPHVATAASAGGGAPMPWTGPLESLLNNLSGPTARIIGALAFVVGGALWAFTRHEEGARRFAHAVVGLAIMIGAANMVSALAFV